MREPDGVVVVIDDDASLRESHSRTSFGSVGLHVEPFASAQEFLRSKRPDAPGLPGARCAPKGPKRARSAGRMAARQAWRSPSSSSLGTGTSR